MKSLGKILGLLLLGILLILAALGFALTHLFDPNDYKDEIQQLARDKANLELSIRGDIGWSLFPWLGLELTDTTLASASTPDKPFADLRLLGLSVRVLPLLRKEVQMSDIRVDGLNLTLQRDKDGHGNWEQIGRPAATPASKTPAATNNTDTAPATAENTGASPLRMDIDSLTLSNARLDYQDARSGRQFTAEAVELATGAIREGSPIPVTLSAYLGSNQPVLRAKTELQAKLRFDRALKRYQLEDLKLNGEAAGEPFKGKTLTFAAQGQLLADLAAGVAEWNSLKLSANQLRAIGELKVHGLNQEPQVEGGLSVAAFNLREFLDGVGVSLPPMQDGETLKRFELTSKLSGSAKHLKLDELQLGLDQTKASGQLEVADFSRQALRLNLKLDQLNLDRYLPAKKADSASAARQQQVKEALAKAGTAGTSELPAAPNQQAWSEKNLLPVDSLKSLDLQADIDAKQLTLRQLPLEAVQIKLQAQHGILQLSELRGELYQGQFDSEASIDLNPAIPQWQIRKQLQRLPVDKVFSALGEKPPVRGLLDFTTQLSAQGNSEKALIDSLDGKADFELLDGALLDANLEQQVCRGIATLNQKSLSGSHGGQDTPFHSLKGSLIFNDGVAHNPDLVANIPGVSVAGKGDLDLRVLGLDYRVGVTLEGDKSEMPDPACQVNERYVGIQWPLLCRGPLELGAKACRLDKDGLGKIAAKLAGDRLNQKIEEKLGDKVSPELKDALKGLFNR